MFTEYTRELSFKDIKNKSTKRYSQILEILGNREMTAREIENEMNKKGYSKYFDLNHVRPRLSELVDLKKIIECGLKEDDLTHKQVTVYRRVEI